MTVCHFASPCCSIAQADPFSQIDAVQTGAATGFAKDVDLAKASKDRVIVSNSQYDTPSNNSGAAHIFKKQQADWVLEQSIGPITGSWFGSSVAINGDGSRVAIGQEAGTANLNVVIYDRSGVSWSLVDTVATSYTVGTISPQIRLDDSGDTLLTKNNSSTGQVEVFRWDGMDFILKAQLPLSGSSTTFAEATDMSQNGRWIVATRRSTGEFIVYEDTTGLGVWSERETVSGVANTSFQQGGASISSDGSIVALANGSALNTWRWNGANYVKVTDNLAMGGIVISVSLSSDASICSVGLSTDAEVAVFVGDGVTPYVLDSTVTPDDPEGTGSSATLSYDGARALVGNNSWKVANGQQGRGFTYEL